MFKDYSKKPKPEGVRDPSSHRTPAQVRKQVTGYNHRPENIKKRDQRNAARAMVEKRLGHPVPSGMDVDHKRPVRAGGRNSPGNLRMISASRNRGWRDGKV